MATVDERTHADGQRRHGRDHTTSLAEVVSIRPAHPRRRGLLGSLVTLARELASPRSQAASARSTPRPPSSPAFLSMRPDDAA
jgi:hypothetical protein